MSQWLGRVGSDDADVSKHRGMGVAASGRGAGRDASPEGPAASAGKNTLTPRPVQALPQPPWDWDEWGRLELHIMPYKDICLLPP